MDFEPSARAQEYLERVDAFIGSRVAPAELRYEQQRRELTVTGTPHEVPAIIEELKAEARARGLWNLFLPQSTDPAHGLSVLDYAPLAERTGWYPQLAPEAMNCSAPDTGNMELLDLFATEEQRERWLNPLLSGEIRISFAMTEPDVASSDAGNIGTAVRFEGDDIVINGRKWWATGAFDPRTAFYIVMGISAPEADRAHRHSFVIVPADTPGASVVRDLSYYGFTDQNGHGEVSFVDVRFHARTSSVRPGRVSPWLRLGWVRVSAARTEIAAIKLAVPRGVCRILDDAVQIFGGAGVSADTPLAALWAAARTMRIADGPDEVHLRSIARAELEKP